MDLYVEVALPLPLPKTFTYRCPESFQPLIQVGVRVLVPFLNKKLTGYVVAISKLSDLKKIRDLDDVLDDRPAIELHLLQLTRWMSDYYLCSWGEAIRNALPSGLNVSSKKILNYRPQYQNPLLEETIDLSHPQGRMLNILGQHPQISVQALKKKMGRCHGFNVLLNRLIKSGEVAVTFETSDTSPKTRYEKMINLSLSPEEAADKIAEFAKKAPKRSACIEYLLAAGDQVSLRQLADAGYSRSIANWLVANKIAEYGQREIFRDSLQIESPRYEISQPLTTGQEAVFSRIRAAIDKDRFETMLIHGITGSGKTRIYIEACQMVCRLGRQALVLVPEIALTPQMIHRFQSAFKKRVGLWHSKLSPGERYDIWRRIRSDDFDVIIGTRSAVFHRSKTSDLSLSMRNMKILLNRTRHHVIMAGIWRLCGPKC